MEEFSRIVLLMVAAALVVNFIQGGPGQVRDWWKAKFLGQMGAGAGNDPRRGVGGVVSVGTAAELAATATPQGLTARQPGTRLGFRAGQDAGRWVRDRLGL